jgi:L,D-transpeptidase YbiS
MGTIFVGRRPTGAIYSPSLAEQFPQRDWILSRILWLQGMEPGRNRGGEVDTLRRFIYIHGTAAEDKIGVPCSHGCIRMRSREIVELFDLVVVGWQVHIHSDWREVREEVP